MSGFENSSGCSEPAQVHMLCFEGPDDYSRAGGLATRVTGLTEALAAAGYDTHLWFIGDPDAPGHETRRNVKLHRWCQWISHYHRGGVYDGEEGKHAAMHSVPDPREKSKLRPWRSRQRRTRRLAPLQVLIGAPRRSATWTAVQRIVNGCQDLVERDLLIPVFVTD